ncbi:hypothetical protein CROQUDRAFT_87380 [Cronartium quercuum f. sp. fusiforme G11]|uniref:Uncharacterized protein n=1 Tax=Cronartium quercuum f. sp. fusiforme G11 TaxID=708437 RepID=A0A9P6NSQ3_9BASI|nr:hypothetical protein CROQUDRAFT_87380 [Cronartium quercuum f. sp. fusiforme G11]
MSEETLPSDPPGGPRVPTGVLPHRTSRLSASLVDPGRASAPNLSRVESSQTGLDILGALRHLDKEVQALANQYPLPSKAGKTPATTLSASAFRAHIPLLPGNPEDPARSGHPGRYQVLDKAMHLNQPVGKFNCDKVAFKDVVTLAEHGLHLVSQADPPPINPPDTILASVLAGVQAIEAKVDLLMLDATN